MGNTTSSNTRFSQVTDSQAAALEKGQFAVRISEDLFSQNGNGTVDGSGIPPSERQLIEEGFNLGLQAMASWKQREVERLQAYAERQLADAQREIESARSASVGAEVDALERAQARVRQRADVCSAPRAEVLECFRTHGPSNITRCGDVLRAFDQCAHETRKKYVAEH